MRFYESCMDGRERARANRYSVEQSRIRFIRARGILKELLGMYTGFEPTTMSFDHGPLGKPYLSPMPELPLQFNSTDTHGEALYAFCRFGEIGVDIEFMNREVSHGGIAKRKFSRHEYEEYLDRSLEKRKNFFLSVWTRKEAYGKAKGVGIRYRLNSVNLIGDEGLSRFSIRDENGIRWGISQVCPALGVTACVVAEGEGWGIRCFRLPDDRPVPNN